MLLMPSSVFLVETDAEPPISSRTCPGASFGDDFEAGSAAGHNCLGLAPGSNLELGGSARLSLTVTALGFFLPALADATSWNSG